VRTDIGSAERQESPGRTSATVRFFQSETTGSVLLLICTIAAVTWANSPWSAGYFRILETKVGFTWNESRFALSLGHWINDGLMALFFFVVGLEIKREILIGELASIRKAVLPVSAAAGGMLLPALIYIGINHQGAGARGWGIPMATDIAFAVGILALLGSHIPAGLKTFVTALAIADDLGAVLVIALFYSDRLSIGPMIAVAVFLASLVVAARLRVRRVAVYAVLVVGVWVGVLTSGIHATVAGILLAMVVPVRGRIQQKRFLTIARQRLAEFEASRQNSEMTTTLKSGEMEVLEELHRVTSDVIPVGPAFERLLHPITAYIVLPLFALFNAGIVLDTKIVHALTHPVGLGVLLGLVVGKPVGITLASWLVIRCRLTDLPDGITWGQVVGAALLAGIGFTMAIFVSDLALESDPLLGFSKTAVLTASASCAAGGYYVLQLASTKTGR
jgi:NhaA family Na+:H+ antiporter